jgi:CubicO group peptidase (beta-lactamase class C family)
MQLVESNHLNLDTDINHYLSSVMKVIHPLHPHFPITLRHLLSHTAGIESNFEEDLQHFKPNDEFTQTNLVDVISKYLNNKSNWLPESPGNVTHYSNIGATLAALIIECVTNISFEQYVQDKILKPLGIDKNEAAYRISNFENRKKDLVEHYIYDSSWLEKFQNLVPQLNIIQVQDYIASNSSNWLYIPHYEASDYPSGFLRMSAHSLAIFLQSFLNNCSSLLLNTSSVEEMLKIVHHEDSDVEFGLIWNWRLIQGRRLVGHRGAVPGVTNVMMANEKRTLGVIILSNGDISKDDDQAKQVYETIINIMLQLFHCFEEV